MLNSGVLITMPVSGFLFSITAAFVFKPVFICNKSALVARLVISGNLY